MKTVRCFLFWVVMLFSAMQSNIVKINKTLFMALVMVFCCVNAYAYEFNYFITIDGVKREFHVYSPDNLDTNVKVPVVVTLSNGMGDLWHYMNFMSLANEHGFVMVACQSAKWNVSGDSGNKDYYEDLKFICKIKDKISKIYDESNNIRPLLARTDPNRFYFVGPQNGAEMVYAASNSASDIFAAFVAIGGYPREENHLRTTGKRPVPFLQVMGQDGNGGTYTRSEARVIMDNMIARNGCTYVGQEVSGYGNGKMYKYELLENNILPSYPLFYYETDKAYSNNLYSNESLRADIWKWLSDGNYVLPTSDFYNNTLVWHPDLSNVTKECSTIGGGDSDDKDIQESLNSLLGNLENGKAQKSGPVHLSSDIWYNVEIEFNKNANSPNGVELTLEYSNEEPASFIHEQESWHPSVLHVGKQSFRGKVKVDNSADYIVVIKPNNTDNLEILSISVTPENGNNDSGENDNNDSGENDNNDSNENDNETNVLSSCIGSFKNGAIVKSDMYYLEKSKEYTIKISYDDAAYSENGFVLKMELDNREATFNHHQNSWQGNTLHIGKQNVSESISVNNDGYYTFILSNSSRDVNVLSFDIYDGSSKVNFSENKARLRKAASATGESHGFTSTDEDVLIYGEKTGASNVYHALQLAAGKYTMTIKTDNPALTLDDVALSMMGEDDNIIEEVSVSEGVITCSSITPSSFDEYTLTISKTGSVDFDVEDIKITGKVTEYDMTIFPDNNVELGIDDECDCYSDDHPHCNAYYPYGVDYIQFGHINIGSGYLAFHNHIKEIGLNNMLMLDINTVQTDGIWEFIIKTGTSQSLDNGKTHFNVTSTKIYEIDKSTKVIYYSIPKGTTEMTVTLKVKDGVSANTDNTITVNSLKLYKVESTSNMTAVLYQFPFSEFVAGDNCSYVKERRTLLSGISPAESGWDFGAGGKDLSAYNYLTVTAAQARTGNSKHVGVTITDVAGNNVSEIEGSALELSSSNPNVLIIPLKKVKAAGINLKKIKTVTFEMEDNDSVCIDNVFATTREPVDLVKYNLSGKSHTKYGTICLPVDAAVSGASIYNVYEVNSTSITISRNNGIIEAGKGYIYRAEEYASPCVKETADTRHDVHFYQVTSRDIWTPIYNNGIMGTLTDIAKVDRGSYVLSNNKIYEVDSDVRVGANKAYFIFETKISAPSTSAGVRLRVLGFDEGEESKEVTTIVDSVDGENNTSIVEYYTVSGTRLDGPVNGINIVRMSDGKVKKMIIK